MLNRIKFPVAVYIFWYLIILFFQIFFQPKFLITSSSDTLTKRLFISWTSYWDAAHYLSIAIHGYHFPQQAFFPLLPVFIKLGTFLNLTGEWSAYLLMLFFSLGNFILFYFLAKKLLKESYAKWALIFFASYPATMFLHASYSENPFLFFTLLSFLLLENKKYFLASIVGGFATASRIAGVALVSSFLLLKNSRVKQLGMMVVGALGLVFYMSFLKINYGDYLYFIKGQMAWCKNAGRCGFVFPLIPLWNYAGIILSGKEPISFFSVRFNDWLSSVVFLFLLVEVWKKLPKIYFVYSLIILLMPLSTGTTTSMTRVTLTAFPIFFILPYLIKNNFWKITLIILLLFLELRFALLFTSFRWVA